MLERATLASALAAARWRNRNVPLGDVICFAKDWSEDPTSNHHVMMELAKTHRVLWLNSIATRTPNFRSPRDLRKIVSKLKSFAKGPEQVAENLWVYTPVVLPFPHSALARRVNQRILRLTIALLRKNLEFEKFQLWTFLPNVADYAGTLGESLLVYYVVDEWSQFSYIDEQNMLQAEASLLKKCDVVFAVCEELAQRKRSHNANVHVSSHGVDHGLFARALDDETPIPEDLGCIPEPRLGFYGTLQDWVDYEILEHLARTHPEWHLVLIGGVHVDLGALADLPNVHLLGRRSHSELPAYCKGFQLGMIPSRITERMRFVNPLKLREYLSAGLPVVSTPVPEVMQYGQHCAIADGPEEFERAAIRVLAENSKEKSSARSLAMVRETWTEKVRQVVLHIEQAQGLT